MPPWLPHVLTLAGVIITAICAVGGTYLVGRRDRRKAKEEADAAVAAAKVVAAGAVESAKVDAAAQVQEAINHGFTDLAEAWRGERGILQEQLTAQTQVIEALKGEIRDLIQHVESLEKVLRDGGLNIPVRRRSERPALSVVGGPNPGIA